MHELSIALSILDLAAEEAERQGGRVAAVHLKLGPLSGVVKEGARARPTTWPARARPWREAELVVEEVAARRLLPGLRRRADAGVGLRNCCCPVCGDADARGRQRPRAGSRRPGDRVMSEHPRLVAGPPARPEAERRRRPRPARRGSARPAPTSSAWSPAPGPARRRSWRRCSAGSRGRYRVAALVGDLATDNDARRLARSGAPVKQITTGTVCHLEAEMVAAALDGLAARTSSTSCSSRTSATWSARRRFDLGEDLRLVLFSVTEGEDKPLKYPTIFNTADVAHHHQDRPGRGRRSSTPRPRIATSSRSGPGWRSSRCRRRPATGMEAWLRFLESRRQLATPEASAMVQ